MYRVHSTIDIFNVTGRINFNDPCLQSIPRDFDIFTDNLDIKKEIINQSSTTSTINETGSNNDNFESIDFFENYLNDDDDSSSNSNEMKCCISIRKAFIPFKGRLLLSIDYCQLEFRIITNLCRDEALINIFHDELVNNTDVFLSLASKWLNLPIDEIDEEKRQNVKKVNLKFRFFINKKVK
jgi:DNA polymerase I-like protein with 3'-5' exonuclease and polymerase domains